MMLLVMLVMMRHRLLEESHKERKIQTPKQKSQSKNVRKLKKTEQNLTKEEKESRTTQTILYNTAQHNTT
jgi:hypothetical protein